MKKLLFVLFFLVFLSLFFLTPKTYSAACAPGECDPGYVCGGGEMCCTCGYFGCGCPSYTCPNDYRVHCPTQNECCYLNCSSGICIDEVVAGGTCAYCNGVPEEPEEPPCPPSCSWPYCGQSDGCPPGTCSTSSIGEGCGSPYCGQLDACSLSCGSGDSGAPSAPGLDPANGGTVYVTEEVPQTSVNWSAPLLADSYYLELYPAGLGYDCFDPEMVYCDAIASSPYSFLPSYSSYYYRVQGINSTCASEPGAWAEATFSVRGTISGTVKQDDDRQAVIDPVSGLCVPNGGSGGGVLPGAGSQVTVGIDSGSVQEGDGTYQVSPLLGPDLYTELLIGDGTEWRCTCPPVDCAYTIIPPKSGLDYYVANIKEAWWQTEEGNIHADGGDVRSAVPNTATVGFLITGSQPGLVSYTGDLDINDATAVNEEGSSDWQAQTNYRGVRTDYGYFERILQDDPVSFPFGVWDGYQPGADGVYAAEGNMATLDAFTITNEKIVILVHGNVSVDYDISVAEGGFLAIISSGNITIANTVTDVQGVYIADGIISSGTGESQLIGEGIFTGWLGIDLSGRDFNSTENNFTPVERFIYRPDLVRNAYRYLLKPKISWQEVAP